MSSGKSQVASWSSVALVILGALATALGADFALQRVSPVPPRIMEVDDGVDAYAGSDPDTLILGSSHARSFEPIRDLLAPLGNQLVLVPAEWGTFTAYDWVLRHRLRPLIEQPKRTRLRRAILVTTFYDLCEIGPTNIANLPARAWTHTDFVRDFAQHGLTDYNRNWLQTKWRQSLGFSTLAQNRGYDRIQNAVVELVRHPDAARAHAIHIRGARQRIEDQYAICDDPDQKVFFENIIQYLVARGVEVTVMLFPLMPSIVSDTGRTTTLARYADHVATLARRYPIRVVDVTFGTPLTDDDFQADFDHVNKAGNHKLAAWLLEHDLQFLKTPVAAGVPRGAPQP